MPAAHGVLLALSLGLVGALVRGEKQEYQPLTCPIFTCQKGNFVYGKFVDRNDYEDEATTREDGVLKLFYFQADDFPYSFPDVTNGKLTNAQEACAQACEKHYNKEAAANGWEPSKYWMFEQTCDDGPGGQCMCMAAHVCEPDTVRWWSDQWQEDWEYGQFFNVPANYTTGKVCKANVEGDPHFTGADGSRFEFSGACLGAIPGHSRRGRDRPCQCWQEGVPHGRGTASRPSCTCCAVAGVCCSLRRGRRQEAGGRLLSLYPASCRHPGQGHLRHLCHLRHL